MKGIMGDVIINLPFNVKAMAMPIAVARPRYSPVPALLSAAPCNCNTFCIEALLLAKVGDPFLRNLEKYSCAIILQHTFLGFQSYYLPQCALSVSLEAKARKVVPGSGLHVSFVVRALVLVPVTTSEREQCD